MLSTLPRHRGELPPGGPDRARTLEELRDQIRQISVHTPTPADTVDLSLLGVERHPGEPAGAHARSPDDHPRRHVAVVIDVPHADEAGLQEARHAPAARTRRVLLLEQPQIVE